MLLYPLSLSFELKARSNLVCGFVQILRVERQTEPKGNTGPHLDIIGKGSNATVVDFSLSRHIESVVPSQRILIEDPYLRE